MEVPPLPPDLDGRDADPGPGRVRAPFVPGVPRLWTDPGPARLMTTGEDDDAPHSGNVGAGAAGPEHSYGDGLALAGWSVLRARPGAPPWMRAHLARRKGIRVDHVLEQVTARHATSRESKLLGVGKTAAMLAMYVAARDASGEPVLVLEVVMPGDRHELEDAYQVG